MKWFRRNRDDFDVEWDLHGTRYAPRFPEEPVPFPEPWREHPSAPDCILLPRALVYRFADERKIRDIERTEVSKTADLRASIASEGLKVPLTMTFDSMGKVRYHDGYHRMTAMRPLDEPQMVPVLLKMAEGRVKAFGLQPEQYMRALFSEIERAITVA